MRYDGHDRQDRWTFPSATAPGQVNAADYEEYGYDANGNRTSLRKRDGRTIAYAYDALDRVTAKTYPSGGARAVYYAYDLRGLQTAARFDGAAGPDAVTSVWDGFGRQTATTTAMAGFSQTLAFQYDANGNRTQVAFPDGVAFAYDHDGLDRLTGVRENGTTPVVSMSYDAAGRSAGMTLKAGAVSEPVAYGYDGIGRLASLTNSYTVDPGKSVQTTFGYNPAGQIVTRTRDNDGYAFTGHVNVDRAYAVNGLNQYSAAGTAAFSYDANGNLTGDGTTTYAYDIENRLLSSSGGGTLGYDPLGRVYKVAAPGAATEFLWDGDQLAAEYVSGTVARRYVHGPGEDDPLLWYEGAGLGDRRAFKTDHQGSVIAVSDGTAVAPYAYDEYGIPNPGQSARFQYTGQAWLGNLGLYYYKARLYSPTLGRFLQTDPIGYDDQINLYAYVGNDPVNRTDSTGMIGSDKEFKIPQLVGKVTVTYGDSGVSIKVSNPIYSGEASVRDSGVSATVRSGDTSVSASADRNGASVAARAGDTGVAARTDHTGAAAAGRAGNTIVTARADQSGASLQARTIQPDRVPRGYAVDRSLEAKVGRPDQVGLRPSPTTGTQRAVEGFRRVLDAISKIFG